MQAELELVLGHHNGQSAARCSGLSHLTDEDPTGRILRAFSRAVPMVAS
jgi:hypothetical protein